MTTDSQLLMKFTNQRLIIVYKSGVLATGLLAGLEGNFLRLEEGRAWGLGSYSAKPKVHFVNIEEIASFMPEEGANLRLVDSAL